MGSAGKPEIEFAKGCFTCNLCNLNFTYKGNLKRHCKKIHESNDVEDKTCSICQTAFSNKANLTKHMKKKHPEQTVPEKMFKHVCDVCNRRFNHLFNLRYHMKKAHSKILPEPLKHKCPLCSKLIPGKMSLIIEHFTGSHNLCIVKNELVFNSFKKFLCWKEKIESETDSRFVRFTRQADMREVYRCHRSGVFVSKSKGLRKLKFQGSRKIDCICPASITLLKLDSNLYKVEFVETHVGHDNDIDHVYLNEKQRLSIACKIANKVPFNIILSRLWLDASRTKLEKRHLLTKKDLYNIQARYKFNQNSEMDSWVLEAGCVNNSCVLCYKTPSLTCKGRESSKEFLLILMNDLQSEVLIGNSKVICLDSTESSNETNCRLIVISVVTDVTVFPCVLIITNKSVEEEMRNIFKLISTHVGKLCSEIIITNVEETLYNCWTAVMEKKSVRLLSPWDFDNSIKQNLNRIKNSKKADEIYQQIVNMREECDKLIFLDKLHLFLKNSDDDVINFLEFFNENFVKRNFNWQISNCDIKISKESQEIYKIMRQLFLNENNSCRIDKAASSIMKYIRDNLIIKFINSENIKEKNQEIYSRHEKAVAQLKSFRIEEYDGAFKVELPGVPNSEIYTVNENNYDCRCLLMCQSCSVCLHCYSCTCINSSLNWNMCEHIHMVCSYVSTEKDVSKERSDFYQQACYNNLTDSNISNEMNEVDSNQEIQNVQSNNVKLVFDNSINSILESQYHNEVETSERSPDLNLSQRRADVTNKILNLLKIVEHTKSVEVIDSVDSFLCSLDSTLQFDSVPTKR